MDHEILRLADRLWRGEARIQDAHPVMAGHGELAELRPGIAFIPSFANVTAVSTAAGLVLVDTGGFLLADQVRAAVRQWSMEPLHTAIYTHGHVDHVFGVPTFEAEARDRGWPAPRVVAHRDVPRRFDRYRLTAGYNSVVNQRQFQAPGLQWPVDYRYPDLVYEDRLDLEVGDTVFELHHARGETDDATWVWIPDRGVLCCGDLFIWSTPNAGNPQKAQRFAADWAVALREMAALGAELMLPGHGLPVAGAERIRDGLNDTAALLESLLEQALALINQGARLDEVIHSVRAPAELLGRPYLMPIYDEPEFVVRNIWRLYAGWYDGNPAHLKPAPVADLAAELARLAGGAGALAARAGQLAGDGDLRLAAHLAELAVQAAPDDEECRAVRAEVYRQRAEAEASTMARGIFSWAALDAGGPGY